MNQNRALLSLQPFRSGPLPCPAQGCAGGGPTDRAVGPTIAGIRQQRSESPLPHLEDGVTLGFSNPTGPAPQTYDAITWAGTCGRRPTAKARRHCAQRETEAARPMIPGAQRITVP